MDETRPSDVSLPMPLEPDGPTTERLRREDGADRTAWPVSASPGSDMAKAMSGGDRGRVESEQRRAVEDSGVHALPEPSIVLGHKVECGECRGTGYLIMSTNDLLKESLALVTDGDGLVREFYSRLLTAAPDLAALFPPDLLTAAAPGRPEVVSDGSALRPAPTRGARQRDKLLGALIALADLYDTDSDEKMGKLDTALRAFGRSHAAFHRPDGRVLGATFDEYAAVKAALFATLADTAGSAWASEYTAAWSEAYDFAAVTMMHEQHRAGFSFPRQARVSS